MNNVSVNLHGGNYVFLHNFAWSDVDEFWAWLAKMRYYFYYKSTHALSLKLSRTSTHHILISFLGLYGFGPNNIHIILCNLACSRRKNTLCFRCMSPPPHVRGRTHVSNIWSTSLLLLIPYFVMPWLTR